MSKYEDNIEDILTDLNKEADFETVLDFIDLEVPPEEFCREDHEHSSAMELEIISGYREAVYRKLDQEYQNLGDQFLIRWWRRSNSEIINRSEQEADETSLEDQLETLFRYERFVRRGGPIPQPTEEDSLEKARKTVQEYDDFAFSQYQRHVDIDIDF